MMTTFLFQFLLFLHVFAVERIQLASTLNIFKIQSLHFVLSPSRVDLKPFDAMGWGDEVATLPKGLALTMRTRFNEASSNPLVKLLSNSLSGEW